MIASRRSSIVVRPPPPSLNKVVFRVCLGETSIVAQCASDRYGILRESKCIDALKVASHTEGFSGFSRAVIAMQIPR